MANKITVQTVVNAPMNKVWEYWNEPKHIVHWAKGSDDWEAPFAENDLRVGGRFKTVMAAIDKSARFDFTGTYTEVQDKRIIEYDIDDGRHVVNTFEETPGGVKITTDFDAENQNPEGQQRQGWQNILNNFKKYTENN